MTTAPTVPPPFEASEPVRLPVRNVRQRKLAVMARCDSIKNDAKYEGWGTNNKTGEKYKITFEYVSIQAVSNALRALAAAEGLDIDVYPDPDDPSRMIVDLVNADEPNDRISHRWPAIQGDKGWAYSTKYPLVRTFLIGDGAAPDEAEMATNSGAATRPAAPPPAETPRGQDSTDPRENRAPASPPASAPTPPVSPPTSNGGSGEGISARELADRIPLYKLAEAAGKTPKDAEAWVNDKLDNPDEQGLRISRPALRRVLDIKLAQAREKAEKTAAAAKVGAAEPEPTPRDPQQLVCPGCGRPAEGSDAPKEVQPGKWRCLAGPGGCGFSFSSDNRITYGTWLKYEEAAKAASVPKEGETELERLARESKRPLGRRDPSEPCAACGVASNQPHADDCPSMAAEISRGHKQEPAP